MEVLVSQSSETINGGVHTGCCGLHVIQTHKNLKEVCHDDSVTPVKAQTIDKFHSLQKKRSAPTTPIKGMQGAVSASILSKEDRHRQQLQYISASLASLTRGTGPKVVKGDPAAKAETPWAAHIHHAPDYYSPYFDVSDNAIKFTHVLYNLSHAELYEQVNVLHEVKVADAFSLH